MMSAMAMLRQQSLRTLATLPHRARLETTRNSLCRSVYLLGTFILTSSPHGRKIRWLRLPKKFPPPSATKLGYLFITLSL